MNKKPTSLTCFGKACDDDDDEEERHARMIPAESALRAPSSTPTGFTTPLNGIASAWSWQIESQRREEHCRELGERLITAGFEKADLGTSYRSAKAERNEARLELEAKDQELADKEHELQLANTLITTLRREIELLKMKEQNDVSSITALSSEEVVKGSRSSHDHASFPLGETAKALGDSRWSTLRLRNLDEALSQQLKSITNEEGLDRLQQVILHAQTARLVSDDQPQDTTVSPISDEVSSDAGSETGMMLTRQDAH